MNKIAVGTLTVVVRDDLFLEGYRAGVGRYQQIDQEGSITDQGMYGLLAQRLLTVTRIATTLAISLVGMQPSLGSEPRRCAGGPSLASCKSVVRPMSSSKKNSEAQGDRSTLYDLGEHALELSHEGNLLLASHPTTTAGSNDPLVQEVSQLDSEETYKLFVALHALFTGPCVLKRE